LQVEQKKKVALLEEKMKNIEKLVREYEHKISELEVFVSVNAKLDAKIVKLKSRVKKVFRI
jgi:flagellar motility protein MotE (MotC chaperone)